MLIRSRSRSIIIKILTVIFLFAGPFVAFAGNMFSPSFVISSDDISAGGGASSTGVTQYRFLITPDAISSDLYYDLSLAPADFWSNVRSDGGDIRVTTQDGTTQVAREVSNFDYAGNTGALFIATSGGTSFYVTYGNPAATEPAANSTYGKYAVWESAAKLVAHLEDVNDSTSNQYNLTTGSGTPLNPAKMRAGYDFNGSTTLKSSSSPVLLGADGFTLSFWVNSSTLQAEKIMFITGPQAGATAYFYTANGTQITFEGWGGYGRNLINQSDAFDGTWHLLTGVYDAGYWEIYLDGQPKSSPSYSLYDVGIGWIELGGYSGGNFTGSFDEARIYSRAFSSTEIATMYANQNDPASFWTTGVEESFPGSFVVNDDLGGNATGENINSASYRACAGYPCTLSIEPPTITFSVAPNIVAFGTLTTGLAPSGDVTITTSTNSADGYVTTVATDGAFRSAGGDQIHGVTDGAVTAGHDEYGIGLTGADRAFADDRSISTVPRVVASNAGSVTSAATIVTFKAAISSTVPAGQYAQIATFVSTSEF